MRRLGSWPGHMALGHVEGLKPKQEIKDAEGEAFLLESTEQEHEVCGPVSTSICDLGDRNENKAD